MNYNDVHLRAISQEKPKPPSTKFCLKITDVKFHSNIPGINGLTHWPTMIVRKESFSRNVIGATKQKRQMITSSSLKKNSHTTATGNVTLSLKPFNDKLGPLLRTWIKFNPSKLLLYYTIWGESLIHSQSVDVWKWTSNLISHVTELVITFQCWDVSWSMLRMTPSSWNKSWRCYSMKTFSTLLGICEINLIVSSHRWIALTKGE